MKVLEIKDIENCLDGTFVKEIFLNQSISEDFIFYLSKIGELQYFSTFPKPFFKVHDTTNKCIAQGIKDNNSIKIILYKENLEKTLANFINYIEAF